MRLHPVFNQHRGYGQLVHRRRQAFAHVCAMRAEFEDVQLHRYARSLERNVKFRGVARIYGLIPRGRIDKCRACIRRDVLERID